MPQRSTALDADPVPTTGNFSSKKGDAIMDGYAKPVTDMTVADINAKNEKLWHNVGPAATQAAAPELAGTRVARNVPVYTGAGIGDEGADAESNYPYKVGREGQERKPAGHVGNLHPRQEGPLPRGQVR